MLCIGRGEMMHDPDGESEIVVQIWLEKRVFRGHEHWCNDFRE